MSGRILNRRNFVAAACTAAGFVVGRLSVVQPRPGTAFAPFAETLVKVVEKMGRLPLAVGKAYLEKNAQVCTLEVLSEALRGRLGISASEWLWSAMGPDPEQLGEMLGEAVRQDFQTEERICQLDGWYLSQTECQLAAVRYLLFMQGGLGIPLEVPQVPFPQREVYQVSRWGPGSTPVGQPFNPQPSGRSAIWIRVTDVPPEAVLYLGNHAMRTTVRPDLITASLSSEAAKALVTRRRRLALHLVDPEHKVQQRIGIFVVGDRPLQ